MGRIKSTLIKRTARILEKEEYFVDQFDSNKKILGNTMPSKSVRNKIAGYIARIKRNRAEEATRPVKPIASKEEREGRDRDKRDNYDRRKQYQDY
jgi:ribosomal protein S17E